MERLNNKYISILIFVMILFGGFFVTITVQAKRPDVIAFHEQQQIVQMLNAMFDALKSGDTGTLKSIFSGEMYEINKVLLEQNTAYPEYLQNYYKGAVFTITEMTPIKKGVIADIDVHFNSKQGLKMRLLLEKCDNVDSSENGTATTPADGSTKWVVTKHFQDG